MANRMGCCVVALLLLTSLAAHAQTVHEFPVSMADGDQWGATVCADGSGGVLLMWHDGPVYGSGIVRLLRLAPGGDRDPRWPEGGLALNDTSTSGRGHALLTDGHGGAYVAMVRVPHATGHNEVRLLHVRPDAKFDPAWGVPGVLVYDGPPLEWNLQVRMAADHAGGLIVARVNLFTWTRPVAQVLMHRLLLSGVRDPAWFPGGIELPTYGGAARQLFVSGDAATGVLVSYIDDDGPYGAWVRHFEHVLPSGTLDPAWPLHAALPCDERTSAVTSDGQGGAFLSIPGPGPLSFYDPPPNPASVWLHHMRRDGVRDPAWPVEGVWLDSWTSSYGEGPAVCIDGAGGLFAVWYDIRHGRPDENAFWTDRDLRAQHVLADGTRDPSWPDSGLVLMAAPGDQAHPAIVADGLGRAIVVWQDDRSGIYPYDPAQGEADVWVSFLDASSSSSAPCSPPVLVSAAPGAQVFPVVASASGGALVVWEDARYQVGVPEVGTYNSDLFAARVWPGTVSVARAPDALALACASPVRGPTLDVSFELPAPGRVTLSVFDLAGRRVLREPRAGLPAGRGRLTLEPAPRLGPGVYWVALEHAGARRTQRVVVLE